MNWLRWRIVSRFGLESRKGGFTRTMRTFTRLAHRVAVFGLAALAAASLPARVSTESDLDALMRRVLARRDDNWKKLQQYVLDEHESIELRGETGAIWGERREYRW